MCVFLSLRADKASLVKRFDSLEIDEESIRPVSIQSAFRFPEWPVITSEAPGQIQLYRWGLIPNWIKDSDAAMKIRASTVNARAETIFQKPAFRYAAREKHCLIIADGFFEFRELNEKIFPYYIRVKGGKPFALAGLYDQWLNPDTGQQLSGFSIITTTANPLLEMIHNRKKRMPVILPMGQEYDWLVSESQGRELLRPFPENQMEAWPVIRTITQQLTSVAPSDLLEPVYYSELDDKKPEQGKLF